MIYSRYTTILMIQLKGKNIYQDDEQIFQPKKKLGYW